MDMSLGEVVMCPCPLGMPRLPTRHLRRLAEHRQDLGPHRCLSQFPVAFCQCHGREVGKQAKRRSQTLAHVKVHCHRAGACRSSTARNIQHTPHRSHTHPERRRSRTCSQQQYNNATVHMSARPVGQNGRTRECCALRYAALRCAVLCSAVCHSAPVHATINRP